MSYHGIFRTKYFYEILNIKVSSIFKKAGEKHFSKERSEPFLKPVHFLYFGRLHALRYTNQALSVCVLGGGQTDRHRDRCKDHGDGENFKTL